MIEALTQYVTSSSEAADDPPHYHYHTGKLHHNHTTPHHYDKMAGVLRPFISTILKAANVSVESYWPGMFAKSAAGLDLKAMAGGVGSGVCARAGGGAAGSGGGAVGAALAAAAAAQLL